MGRQFDAVIFDLDGTLADTLEDLSDAMNASLRDLGQPVHSVAMYRKMVGAGVANLARSALPPDREDLLEQALAGFRSHYSAHIADTSRPYPGIPELLDALTGRGLKRAILSNKVDAMTKRIGELCFGRWTFDVIYGERSGVPRKPDPTSALEIAALLKVAPGRTVFVGDTAIDMKTAANAGMYGVGVRWGFRSEELEPAGAKAIISSPLELLSVLDAG
ncbi:MAG: HAD family hydrolase [Myxococcaceae bacterium]